MLIFGTLLIPVFVALMLYFKFRHKMVWWEYTIPLGVSLVLTFGMKAGVEQVNIRDTEYWGGWVTKVEWYAPWNERVSCGHPDYCNRPGMCRDMQGKMSTCIKRERCGNVHSYDVEYHPQFSQFIDSNGAVHRISEETYGQLRDRWGNQSFVELNRRSHTIDGDVYVSQ